MGRRPRKNVITENLSKMRWNSYRVKFTNHSKYSWWVAFVFKDHESMSEILFSFLSGLAYDTSFE